ncbi:hypothetical protein PFICI_11341 [Pestalotiopsis fici W106-1]|uniref:YAG7-like dimerisation domain-containing protein n=1 Tax=Pestalotiopsis fici (strain W106-1 / CGMCC3.15140) TaxID=1229662 RepID=W3WWG1_PESFW|nr:uncharacterized protein PFICI_11341 [Pestalotiopsis fici W106-1]ETS77467.1 hypothetical protein PFICI_11341 [Pestalotiopsis fici W106-1]
MPLAAVQNPPAPTESKSAKKKKAKAEQQRTDSPAPTASPAPEKAASVSGDDAAESPYVKELQKNIRNVAKKISNVNKTVDLISQYKGKSLDELVAAKIINPDQKSQISKKPQLESQLAQLEEQVAQYKKVDEEYRSRGAADKAKLEKELTEKLEKEKADALVAVTAKAAADIQKAQHDGLLVLSQFLRLAAARRSEDADAGLDENMALEGVLLNVYSGDENAVSTMLKLIEGSEEKTRSVSGDELQTTFAQVKEASTTHAKTFAVEAETEAETEANAVPEAVESAPAQSTSIETDPTIAYAGLTEIDTVNTSVAPTNGHAEPTSASGIPASANVGDEAANAAAESQWDPASNDLSASVTQEDWVKVPRDPAETETGLEATPAATGPVQSWADDQPEHATEAPAQADDGFQSVQRNRPRGQGDNNGHRGRGRGDGYRGRGRGDGRGRGRGQGRGNFGNRGARRGGES